MIKTMHLEEHMIRNIGAEVVKQLGLQGNENISFVLSDDNVLLLSAVKDGIVESYNLEIEKSTDSKLAKLSDLNSLMK